MSDHLSGTGLAAEENPGSQVREDVERHPDGSVRQVFFLDQDSPEPLYLQVAAHVRGRIVRGELTGRLFSEPVMAGRYGVSRRTIREALRCLADEGLVTSRQGRGTFVIPPAGRARPGPVRPAVLVSRP